VRKGIRAAARKTRTAEDPVSVILPAELRNRIELEAEKRGLKVSPTIRLLVKERVDELDERDALDRALEWQRAEAWATWERIRGGDFDEVTPDEVEAEFERALRPRRTGR
jgi:hypothetical protein